MLKRRLWLALGICWMAASPIMAFAVGGQPSPAARLATYEKEGVSYFALSVMPELKGVSNRARDVLVLVDTSASQAGAVREISLEAVRSLASRLSANDRIKLVAVDVEPAPMHEGWLQVGSSEWKAAVETLKKRTPLGATRLKEVLEYAVTAFEDAPNRTRCALYIGDGVTVTNMTAQNALGDLTAHLRDRKIAFSSLAIGYDRDVALLSCIGNLTGGNILVANNETTGSDAGASLARVVAGSVIWPESVVLPEEMQERQPAVFPPLRTDRDTIVLGTLQKPGDFKIFVRGEIEGKPVSLQWATSAEPSSPDFAFLPRLIEFSKPTQGTALPAIGSMGLREISLVFADNSRRLSSLSELALLSGDAAGAKEIAKEALSQDPANSKAEAFLDIGEEASKDVETPKGEEIAYIAQQDPADEGPADSDILLEANNLEKAKIERATAEVNKLLKDARATMSTNPSYAREDLKILLENIERSTELTPAVRRSLRAKVETMLREVSLREIEFQQRELKRLQDEATAAERDRVLQELERREARRVQLMDRYRALMEEGRFMEAEDEIAKPLRDETPKPTPEIVAALFAARIGHSVYENRMIVDRRQRAIIDTLLAVEQSHIPFPDDTPIVFPTLEFWNRITEMRKEYSQVELSSAGPKEAEIFSALEEALSEEFAIDGESLADVIPRLEEAINSITNPKTGRPYDIQITIDTQALEDAGVETSTTITKNLRRGILVKSALKIVLAELGEVTYMVKNEVLVITSKEKASDPENLLRKVYPVGDLVVPVISGGGMMGGMGGMMGGMGGMGGMMGGMGGMGGMMGGMGGMGGFGGGMMGGMGGMGGFMAVADDLRLGPGRAKKSEAMPAEAPRKDDKALAPAAKPEGKVVASEPRRDVAPIAVTVKPGQSESDAWDEFFAAHQDDAKKVDFQAAVRAKVREHVRKQEFGKIRELISSALRNGHGQGWMYEALALALEADNASEAEIARAVLSAVDISRDADAALVTADYLASLKFDRSALRLFQDIASQDPYRPEPYVQGLRSAQRLGDIEGIKWACLGVLKQAWPADQRQVETYARRVAEGAIADLRKAGKAKEADLFSAELNKVLARDVRVRVWWTGDADVDLAVMEPTGDVCSYRNPQTTGGGMILGDSFARNDASASREGFSETFVCTEGFSGEYKVLLKRVWGEVAGGKVNVEVITHYGTDKETVVSRELPLAKDGTLITFNLDEGRRSEPLAARRAEVSARRHIAVARHVLAQQLDVAGGSGSSSETWNNSNIVFVPDAFGRLIVPAFRGAVGFRPQITTLQDGPMLFAGPAVVSADRRFVRMTLSPAFYTIGEVQTFNFATGTVGNGDLSGGDGDGGGGGGGVGGS